MREFKNKPSLFLKLTNFALIAAQSVEATSYISTLDKLELCQKSKPNGH